jgi:hypothetical protein
MQSVSLCIRIVTVCLLFALSGLSRGVRGGFTRDIPVRIGMNSDCF